MTRDKAIEIEKKKLNRFNPNRPNIVLAEANVDALIEMGVLVVEEPETANDMLREWYDNLGRAAYYEEFERGRRSLNLKLVVDKTD